MDLDEAASDVDDDQDFAPGPMDEEERDAEKPESDSEEPFDVNPDELDKQVEAEVRVY